MQKQDTRPRGSDLPRPYKRPRGDDRKKLTLEEELDAGSVFDPLVPGSQSSQQSNSQSSVALDAATKVAGPKTPPHFSEVPVSVPPFDLSLIGIPAQMSPVTEGENALLNLAPGSPMMNMAAARIGRGVRGLGQSSCSDSPMSLGSPVISLSIRIALRICAQPAMPPLFDHEGEEDTDHEEDMDAAIEGTRHKED